MSISEDTRVQKTRAFYDSDSGTYDDERWTTRGGAITNAAQQRILRALCLNWTKCNILEVGSGTARFSIPLLQRGNRLTLADLSPEMLAVAKRKIESERLGDSVEAYVQASVYELPFETSRFDHALCLNVLNHLDNPSLALKQLARVIRKNGTLLFNYANLYSYYWPAAVKVNRDCKAVGRDVYSVWRTAREIEEMVSAAGLRLESRLGHVHVPSALDWGPWPYLISLLDLLSRRGPLSAIASFHFCLCRKVDSNDAG